MGRDLEAHPDAGEQGADLGAQFFPGVLLRVEARLPSLVQGGPVEALGMTGGMGEFVQERPIVGGGHGKPAPPGQGDPVVLAAVGGPVAVDVAHRDAAGADDALDAVVGQPVGLVPVLPGEG